MNGAVHLTPIAPELWSGGDDPHLIGGRYPNGEIVFPRPRGDAADAVEPVALAREGILWSWTRQDFEPKPPYGGPTPFVPFLIGYVELPEVIVETRIVGAPLDALWLGMPMRLVIVPFDEHRATYAFEPSEVAA